jgi:hypothetical protein
MRVPRARVGLGAPLALAAAAFIGCSGIADPSAVAALEFNGVPFPAIVTGDSLRDSTGAAAVLTATVYDGRGDVMPGAPVEFFSLDTGVVIHPNGHVVATRRDGAVRLVAVIGALQSQRRTVQVTRQPDSTLKAADTVTFSYAIPDKSSNVAPAVSFRLLSSDTVGVSPNVAGWVVRWRVLHNGDTLAATDTSLVALWDASGSRHSLRDTTGTDGVSSRRLRVYANNLPVQPDSFIVVAEVKALGAHVLGSPLRFTVLITPPSP